MKKIITFCPDTLYLEILNSFNVDDQICSRSSCTAFVFIVETSVFVLEL